MMSRTLIDHIATNLQRNILQSGVLKVSMSDHYIVYRIRKFNGSLSRDHKTVKTRSMKKFSKSHFLTDISQICWDNIIMPCRNVEELVSKWASVFSALIEKHAPYRELRVFEKYCPWVTPHLKNLIRKRDNLKRAAIKSKSTTLMTAYKNVRNQATSLNRELKKQHFAEKIAKERGNMKGTWKIINQLVNKRSKSTNISCLKPWSNKLNISLSSTQQLKTVFSNAQRSSVRWWSNELNNLSSIPQTYVCACAIPYVQLHFRRQKFT